MCKLQHKRKFTAKYVHKFSLLWFYGKKKARNFRVDFLYVAKFYSLKSECHKRPNEHTDVAEYANWHADSEFNVLSLVAERFHSQHLTDTPHKKSEGNKRSLRNSPLPLDCTFFVDKHSEKSDDAHDYCCD